MKGYHYTSWENWERIREEGLKPYRIVNRGVVDFLGPEADGIFTWTRRASGLAHYGQIMWAMMHHNSFRIVYLSYDYTMEEIFRNHRTPAVGGTYTIFHQGNLDTGYGRPWHFHVDEPATLVGVPIAPERITLEAVYDFKEMVDCADFFGAQVMQEGRVPSCDELSTQDRSIRSPLAISG